MECVEGRRTKLDDGFVCGGRVVGLEEWRSGGVEEWSSGSALSSSSNFYLE
jgi:hypothetical protein